MRPMRQRGLTLLKTGEGQGQRYPPIPRSYMGEGNARHARTAWWVARWLYLTRVRLEVMHESATSDCGYGGDYNRRVAGRASPLFHFAWDEAPGGVRSPGKMGVHPPQTPPGGRPVLSL